MTTWMWRALFAVLFVVLIVVADNADRRVRQHPARPTHQTTEVQR
jgi:hypothetical protein